MNSLRMNSRFISFLIISFCFFVTRITSKTFCPIVLLKNGTINITDEKITYSCHETFRLRGAKEAKCELDENGKYYVTADPPKCEVKPRCFLPNISNLILEENKCCYAGSVYEFSCATGWDLKGSSSLECDENGNWLGPLPFCKEKHCHVNPPINGRVEINDLWITYTCNYGFRTKNLDYDICIADKDGNYFAQGPPPICEAIPHCPKAENSLLIYSKDCCFGDYWHNFSCPVNYTLQGNSHLKCNSNGNWRAALPTCQEGNVKEKVDVQPIMFYFLVDTSRNIMKRDFNRCKDFIKMVLRKVENSRSSREIRVNVITFSSEIREIFLPSVKEIDLAVRFVEEMANDGRGTNINLALKTLDALLTSQFQDKRRSPNKTIVFLMSDGKISEGGKPYELAHHIRRFPTVEFYGIAVGESKKEVLRKIICGIGNKCRKLFTIKNLEGLLQLVDLAIAEKTKDLWHCGLKRPQHLSHKEMTDKRIKGRFKRSMKSKVHRFSGRSKDVQRPWPWLATLMVSYGDLYFIHCGGVIIAETWILTSATCFNIRKNVEDWIIVVGSTDSSLTSGIEFGAEEIIFHEDFKLDPFDFDIALVKLKEEIPYNPFINPICLPPIYDELSENSLLYRDKETATFACWHRDVDTYKVNDTFEIIDVYHQKKTEISIQKKEICSQPFSFTSCFITRCFDKTFNPTERMFCAENRFTRHEFCYGAVGGPLMQQVESKGESRWFVIGIANQQIRQKRSDEFYTHVAKLRDWINNKTQVVFEDVVPL